MELWNLVIPGELQVFTRHWNPEEVVLMLVKKCLGDSSDDLTSQSVGKQAKLQPLSCGLPPGVS